MNIFDYPIDNRYILRNKKSIKKALLKEGEFINKNIAILSGSTIGNIKEILEIFLLSNGIKPSFYIGKYNRFYEEAVFENQELDEFNPDIVYIHTSNRNITEYPNISDTKEDCDLKLSQEYERFEQVWQSISQKYNCPIIQNNFEMLPYRTFGNSDIYLQNGWNNFINRLNNKIYEYANKNSNFFINDINYLSSFVGLENWADTSYWYLYKYSLNVEYIPVLCNSISNIIKSFLGKNKKALVLDLDNTLWGGVIGDDGLDNIKIGDETPEGSAYLEFQRYIKRLGEMGILLNVSSKNTPESAKLGLSHPSSLLEYEDFIMFEANWEDKYKNISNIIKELNIMEDSVVFVDDNPIERDSVKSFIPNIEVPNMKSVEEYIQTIDKSGYFEVTKLTADDKERSNFYKTNQKRNKEKSNFKNYQDYLKSLDMKCTISNFNNSNIKRITQLINKTNQFNLTSNRYTQSEIENISENNSYITLSVTLSDKFGDNGIVSSVIAKIEKDALKDALIIENWVMSCRVFKRNLELAIFDRLVEMCKQKDIRTIKGVYKETSKNDFVRLLYKELGFESYQKVDNKSIWLYNIPKAYINKNTEIEVL